LKRLEKHALPLFKIARVLVRLDPNYSWVLHLVRFFTTSIRPLRENRGFVCLQKRRQSHRVLSADLLHQVVRSRKHSILVVFRNLLEMLPQRSSWRWTYARTLTPASSKNSTVLLPVAPVAPEIKY